MPTVFPRASRIVLSARPDNTNGLVARYSGSAHVGVAGSILFDSYGNQIALIRTNGAITSVVPSPYGPAFNMNVGSFTSNDARLSPVAFTFAGWINSPSPNHTLFGSSISTLPILSTNTSGAPEIGIVSTRGLAISSVVVANNTWAHVAGTYDGVSAWAIYVNGVRTGTGSSAKTWTPGSGPIGIGNSALSSNGLMADVRVYNRALSAAEIYDIYAQAGRLQSEPEMMALAAGTIPSTVTIIGAGLALSAQQTAETIFVFI